MLISPLGSVPATRFNQVIDKSRSFASVTISLPRITAISGATQSTVNDVVRALIGHTLNQYLPQKNESPGKTFYALMPFSVHTDKDKNEANRQSICCYSLESDRLAPLDQNTAIKQATTIAKK